jgi:hypothetical protein
MQTPVFTDQERTDIGRLILLKLIQRRLEQNDAQAGPDVKAALDAVDPGDWISCLRWACVLANQCEGR